MECPTTFRTLMNVFRDILDICIIIYMDDILVYSKTPEQYEQHLRQVLQRLREHQLYARPTKYILFTDTIDYLGHLVTPEGIKPNPALVEPIVKYPDTLELTILPRYDELLAEVRQELYQTRTTPDTGIAKRLELPAYHLEPRMEGALQDLKDTRAPCLRLPDPDDEFEVTTDASEEAKAVGCVPTQNGRPIPFESKKSEN
jgi:hypothetical protein